MKKWISNLSWKAYTLVAWGLNVLVTRFLTNLCKDFNRALKKFMWTSILIFLNLSLIIHSLRNIM
nr:hypothetical protein Iba_chr02bCG9980 [Ipomoea batatas]